MIFMLHTIYFETVETINCLAYVFPSNWNLKILLICEGEKTKDEINVKIVETINDIIDMCMYKKWAWKSLSQK